MFAPYVFSPPLLGTKKRNNGRQGSGETSTGDVKIKCRGGLHEAWHKSLKHGDTKLIVIGIVSGYLIESILYCGISSPT